ncbi:hypothetical protein GYMLUDRAFT_245732 [Collybiopsis luxurians FD-317 M1]|uniref:Uncharacterized protein n=1 Tax=Collybiopsis luxurians FD-317 M1 TaxID=944289 RepID=A0A0D0CKK2_9AGAR|nr:hypothetical protein GYMLUDRAFT_245732 [Collybiopsis luxurians FD-317 M1]
MPFTSSWVKTDTGFDEDTSPSVLVSDEREAHLRTKFLWHYVPTYVMVLGTVYEQEFIKLAKQISFPDGGNSSEWKLKALPAWYDGSDTEERLKLNNIVRTTLYTIYKENNGIYKELLSHYTDEEARHMCGALREAICNFLKRAVTKASSHIMSYGLPPYLWKTSLYGAILLWAIHNLLPLSFNRHTWAKYHYLDAVLEGIEETLWEYPKKSPIAEGSESDGSMDLTEPWEPWRDIILF